MENVEILKENCKEYAKTRKSIDVLKKANGKNHYTEIAKIVGMHNTTVSGLLKKAEKLGLAKKIGAGIYKKIPGILGYMPRGNNFKNSVPRTVRDFSQRVATKRITLKTSFPSGLTIQNRIITSIDRMVAAYQFLYAVENSLRELIRKVLSQKADWWQNHIPNDIRIDVENTIKNAPYHAVKRNDQLEYTHLGQLKKIIICKKNWGDFLIYLNTKDKSDFSATVDKAIPSRNAIGHCIPLKPKDLKVVDIRLQDILEMIK